MGTHRRAHVAEIAGEHAAEVAVMDQGFVQAQRSEELGAVGDVLGIGQRCRRHWHVVAGAHLARAVILSIRCGFRIGPQLLHQRVIHLLSEACEAGGGGWRRCAGAGGHQADCCSACIIGGHRSTLRSVRRL